MGIKCTIINMGSFWQNVAIVVVAAASECVSMHKIYRNKIKKISRKSLFAIYAQMSPQIYCVEFIKKKIEIEMEMEKN